MRGIIEPNLHLLVNRQQPALIAFGPGIRAGAVVEHRPIVDEAATFAKDLRITMGAIDGKPIDEILKS